MFKKILSSVALVCRRLVTSTLAETPDVSMNSRMTDDHLHNR